MLEVLGGLYSFSPAAEVDRAGREKSGERSGNSAFFDELVYAIHGDCGSIHRSVEVLNFHKKVKIGFGLSLNESTFSLELPQPFHFRDVILSSNLFSSAPSISTPTGKLPCVRLLAALSIRRCSDEPQIS